MDNIKYFFESSGRWVKKGFKPQLKNCEFTNDPHDALDLKDKIEAVLYCYGQVNLGNFPEDTIVTEHLFI